VLLEPRQVTWRELVRGPGGLESEKVVASLRRGFEEKATADACLTISIPHKDVYERLRANRKRIAGAGQCAVRVFISHASRTSDEEEWVKELALF
jgi:hypothetical protein